MNTANAASGHSPKPRSALSNLTQRVLSAVVLLPVLALVVWLGGWWVAGTVLIVAVLTLRELYGLFQAGGYQPRRVGYVLGAAFVLAAISRNRWNVDVLGAVVTFAVLASLAAEVLRHEHERALLNWVLTLSGAAYVGWLLAHFVLLRGLQQPLASAPLAGLLRDSGAAWIVWVLLITFGSDTGAYFAGRTFGRHRMAPVISPKKSWEGAVGGLLTSMVVGAVVAALLGLPLNLLVSALLGVLGSAVGQMGDLGESLIKRQVGVKDSGNLIPGHGGMLDRVDSLLFSVPVLYYCAVWLTR